VLRNTNGNFISDEWVDGLKKILNILGSLEDDEEDVEMG